MHGSATALWARLTLRAGARGRKRPRLWAADTEVPVHAGRAADAAVKRIIAQGSAARPSAPANDVAHQPSRTASHTPSKSAAAIASISSALSTK